MCGVGYRNSSGWGDKVRNHIETSLDTVGEAAWPTFVASHLATPSVVPPNRYTGRTFLTVSSLNVIVWYLIRETEICSNTGGEKGKIGHIGLIYTQTVPHSVLFIFVFKMFSGVIFNTVISW